MVNLTLPEPPSSNRLWRNHNGRMVLSAEAREYKQHVSWLCLAAGVEPLHGEVSLTIRWYRQRKAGDTSNRIKLVEDSLQGWCYDNDSQVSELHVYRKLDRKNPRVEVELRPAQNEFDGAPVTPEAVDAYLRSLGYDPDAMVERMREMWKALQRAKHAAFLGYETDWLSAPQPCPNCGNPDAVWLLYRDDDQREVWCCEACGYMETFEKQRRDNAERND